MTNSENRMAQNYVKGRLCKTDSETLAYAEYGVSQLPKPSPPPTARYTTGM